MTEEEKAPDESEERPPWTIRVHDKRRKAFRFQTASDIVLLRQVASRTPWASPHGETGPTWDSIATSFKVAVPRASVDGRACRRRYLALQEAYRTGKLHQLRGAAGSPAVHAEREQLLARCQFLTDDYRRQKTNKGSTPEESAASDGAASARAFELTGSEVSEATAVQVEELRPFATLQEPRALPVGDPHVLLRQRELELEERRLRLEEQRFEQQRHFAERQLEMMAAQTSVLLKLAEKLTGDEHEA